VISVKVEPLDKDIELIFREDLSPEARSKHLANFAREKLKEGQDKNRQALGRLPDHTTFVDGTRRADETVVRPDGTILYEFNLLEDMFGWVGEQLVIHSPYREGGYERGHRFFADGTEVEPGAPISPKATEFVFLNIVPYARKIEKGLSNQAPEGVYEAVAALARRRFGNMAAIKFSYRAPAKGSILEYVSLGGVMRDRKGRFWRSLSARRADADRERAARQPAIVITLRV